MSYYPIVLIDVEHIQKCDQMLLKLNNSPLILELCSPQIRRPAAALEPEPVGRPGPTTTSILHLHVSSGERHSALWLYW